LVPHEVPFDPDLDARIDERLAWKGLGRHAAALVRK